MIQIYYFEARRSDEVTGYFQGDFQCDEIPRFTLLRWLVQEVDCFLRFRHGLNNSANYYL